MSLQAGMFASLATLLLAGGEVDVDEGKTAPTQGTAKTAWRAGEPKSVFPTSPRATNGPEAQGSLRFVRGFDSGSAQATAAGKPMLVFFTAEWCHYCHQMADEAFANPQVVGLANRFVCILVDADAEPGVCKQFRVQGYPTVQFLSPRGVPLNRLVGKKPSQQVMAAMQAALQSIAHKSAEGAATQR